jgi:hypothetical protein
MVELSENWAEMRPSFWSAPIWKGYRPLCMGAGKVSSDALCKMVAIEAIAVYCSKPGSQNGNPE